MVRLKSVVPLMPMATAVPSLGLLSPSPNGFFLSRPVMIGHVTH